MKELEKEIQEKIISIAMQGGYKNILNMALGKCYCYSDVLTFLISASTNYYILGQGVIYLEDNFNEDIDNSFLENISNNFIEISTQEQFEKFKKHLEIIKTEHLRVKEENKKNIDEQIMKIIIEELPNEAEENRKKLLVLVKAAEGKTKEKLLVLMDSAYEIVGSQGKITEIFMANPNLKISKNTYNRKEREKVINNGK